MRHPIPDDAEINVAIVKALEKHRLISEATLENLVQLHARVVGLEAGRKHVAESVDDLADVVNKNADVANENQARIDLDRQVAAQKDLITHLHRESHQYVALIIAGAFAAYFTTLSVLADRFTDTEIRLSALLMTVSLTVFVIWEIVVISYTGVHAMKGDLGAVGNIPRWQQIGWPIAMFGSLATALPAVGFSLYAYLRGLGVVDLGTISM